MKIFYMPMRSDREIFYNISGETISVTLEGVTDVFDFSGFTEDGILQGITTTLEFNPIISAERINGELHVKVINFHGPNAPKEILFPDWITV